MFEAIIAFIFGVMAVFVITLVCLFGCAICFVNIYESIKLKKYKEVFKYLPFLGVFFYFIYFFLFFM